MSDKRRAVKVLTAIATLLNEGLLTNAEAAAQIMHALPMLDRVKLPRVEHRLQGGTRPAEEAAEKEEAAVVPLRKDLIDMVRFKDNRRNSAGYLRIRGSAAFELREAVRASLPELKAAKLTDTDIAVYFDLGSNPRVSEIRNFMWDTDDEKSRSPWYKAWVGRRGV